MSPLSPLSLDLDFAMAILGLKQEADAWKEGGKTEQKSDEELAEEAMKRPAMVFGKVNA